MCPRLLAARRAAQASHPRGVCASALLRSSVGVDIHAVRALPTTSVLVDLAACCQASLALLTWQPRIGHTRPRLSGLPPATDVPAYLETPYWPNLRLLARGLAASPKLDSLIWQRSAGCAWACLSGSLLPAHSGLAYLAAPRHTVSLRLRIQPCAALAGQILDPLLGQEPSRDLHLGQLWWLRT